MRAIVTPTTMLLSSLKASGILYGDSKPFRYTSDEPFAYDVQKRVPAVDKAEKILGFKADTPLDNILDEVIPWIIEQVKLGGI